MYPIHIRHRSTGLLKVTVRAHSLYGANLRRADLRRADLYGADLCGANLYGTCLDPDAVMTPPKHLDGFEVRGNLVSGWRTETSRHCGNTTYESGRCYRAPVFSVDTGADCHPGIYIATKEWMAANYPNATLVRCFCRLDEMVQAGDKYRCKRLWVPHQKFWEGEGVAS